MSITTIPSHVCAICSDCEWEKSLRKGALFSTGIARAEGHAKETGHSVIVWSNHMVEVKV